MAGAAPDILVDLAMVAGLGAVTGQLARKIGQPPILGYLLAGLILGPSVPVPLFADPSRVGALAEIGVVLVMFAIGLEFRLKRLLEVLPVSGFTGLVQIGVLGWAGVSLGAALGWSPTASAFLGAALCISSTMVVSGIFRQVPVAADVRAHTLGVLVVQDVVAIVLVTAASAVAAGRAVAPEALVELVLRMAAVLLAMVSVGLLLVPRLVRAVVGEGSTEGVAVLAAGLAFGFAVLAAHFGFSVALGAFVAGILVAESGHGAAVEHAVEPLRAFFAAVFFVSIGMSVDPALAWSQLPVAVLVAAVVVVAQLGSVTLGSLLSGSPLSRAITSGLALGQVGEFSFILAAIGAGAGLVPKTLLPTLVTVAALTSFTTPLLLRRADRLVRWADRALPERVRRALVLVQSGAARARVGGAGAGRIRSAALVIALDGVVLVLLGVGAVTFQDRAVAAARAALRGPDWLAPLLVDLGGVLLALPLFVGLVRNARVIAGQVGARLGAGAEGSRAAVGRAAEAVVHLGLVVGLGLPALAVLRPLVQGPWGEPLLVVALAVAVVLAWRSFGALDAAYTSGAAEIARRLVAHAGAPAAAAPVPPAPPLLPGLDDAVPVPIVAGAAAVGQTLAALDLRARTGATVVAICTADATVVLPAGDAALAVGDVLALIGAPESIARARALLSAGPAAALLPDAPLTGRPEPSGLDGVGGG